MNSSTPSTPILHWTPGKRYKVGYDDPFKATCRPSHIPERIPTAFLYLSPWASSSQTETFIPQKKSKEKVSVRKQAPSNFFDNGQQDSLSKRRASNASPTQIDNITPRMSGTPRPFGKS